MIGLPSVCVAWAASSIPWPPFQNPHPPHAAKYRAVLCISRIPAPPWTWHPRRKRLRHDPEAVALRFSGTHPAFLVGSSTASRRRRTVMGRITSRYFPRTKTSRRTSSAMFQIKLVIQLSCAWSMKKRGNLRREFQPPGVDVKRFDGVPDTHFQRDRLDVRFRWFNPVHGVRWTVGERFPS